MTGSGSTAMHGSRATLLAAAAIVVIAALLHVHHARSTIADRPVRADAADYVSYAYNLTEHGVYSRTPSWLGERPPPVADAVRSPGYPLLLAPLLGGVPDVGFVRRVFLVQALLGTLSVLLAMLLARRIVGDRAALAVGALTAASPHLIASDTHLLTETAFTTLLLGAAVLADTACRRRTLLWFAMAGAVVGFATLVRPTALLLPVAMLVAVVLFSARPRWLVAGALAATLAAAAVVAPWMARNAMLPPAPDQPSLLANFLHHGSYPDLMFDDIPESYGYPYAFDPAGSAKGASAGAAFDAIAADFAAQPARMLRWYLLGKPLTFLSWSHTEGNGEFYTYPMRRTPYQDHPAYLFTASLMKTLHWPLVLLALAACAHVLVARRVPRPAGAYLVALVVAYALAIHAAGAPFPRYSLPFKPFLYTLAVLALAGLFARFQQVRPADAPTMARDGHD